MNGTEWSTRKYLEEQAHLGMIPTEELKARCRRHNIPPPQMNPGGESK